MAASRGVHWLLQLAHSRRQGGSVLPTAAAPLFCPFTCVGSFFVRVRHQSCTTQKSIVATSHFNRYLLCAEWRPTVAD